MIALLRGINVGGRHKVSMSSLRELCHSLDLNDPCTLLQSGNLLFRTKQLSLSSLRKNLESGFDAAFGFHSEIILRTTPELRDTVAANPFAKRADVEPAKLHTMLLSEDPQPNAREEISRLNIHPEEVHLDGREVFIYFPDGMGRSKLPWAKLDKTLGTPGTARNWNTVTKLLKLAEEMEIK